MSLRDLPDHAAYFDQTRCHGAKVKYYFPNVTTYMLWYCEYRSSDEMSPVI
jgi:hypothetical protein